MAKARLNSLVINSVTLKMHSLSISNVDENNKKQKYL